MSRSEQTLSCRLPPPECACRKLKATEMLQPEYCKSCLPVLLLLLIQGVVNLYLANLKEVTKAETLKQATGW